VIGSLLLRVIGSPSRLLTHTVAQMSRISIVAARQLLVCGAAALVEGDVLDLDAKFRS